MSRAASLADIARGLSPLARKKPKGGPLGMLGRDCEFEVNKSSAKCATGIEHAYQLGAYVRVLGCVSWLGRSASIPPSWYRLYQS